MRYIFFVEIADGRHGAFTIGQRALKKAKTGRACQTAKNSQ
jgi:hypothetical protein